MSALHKGQSSAGLATLNADLESSSKSGGGLGTTAVLENELPFAVKDDVYAREEWRLACRVAASKGLSKSEFLANFLLYVCDLSLQGRESEITEQKIGMQIFNRPRGYNPAEDNIVRSYARVLRKRLEQYFTGEGRDEKLILTIPRGGYVPVFEVPVSEATVLEPPVSAVPVSDQADPAPEAGLTTEILELPTEQNVDDKLHPAPVHEIVASPVWWRQLWAVWAIAIGGILLGVAIAFAWMHWKGQHENKVSAAHLLWTTLFQSSHNTLIVPADSGLGILENLSKRSVTIEQYANGAYLSEMAANSEVDTGNLNDLGRQRYTSVVDLDIATRLTQLPEYIPNRSQIRYARGVTTEDIKDSNSILLGSKHTNPWVSLFESSMNFTLEYTSTVDESFIVNHAPRDGEQAVYRNGSSATSNSGHTYGVIAYLPNLNGTGHVLIIEGLNMAATQAAAEILFNGNAIRPILQKVRASDGTLKPFELLIETSSVGAASPGASILATRIHNQP